MMEVGIAWGLVGALSGGVVTALASMIVNARRNGRNGRPGNPNFETLEKLGERQVAVAERIEGRLGGIETSLAVMQATMQNCPVVKHQIGGN